MKSVFVVILLIIIAFSSVAYVFLIKINLFLIHKEVKRALVMDLPDSAYTILTIEKKKQNLQNGFVAIHSREFRYNGMMFDVVSSRDSADCTIFKCIRDEDEEDVFRVLSDIITMNYSGEKSDRMSHMPLFFNFLFFENLSIILPINTYSMNEVSNIYTFKLISNAIPPHTPPPIAFIA